MNFGKKDINEYPPVDTATIADNFEKNEKAVESKIKTSTVKVFLATKKDSTGISFNGYGIMLSTPNKIYAVNDEATLKYEGTIGKPDFKVIDIS